MKRLSFISCVLSAFLLIGFWACEPTHSVNPPISTSESGYVDLGLSVKWATMNVGANSPEEYGDFYEYNKAKTNGGRVPSNVELEELVNGCQWEWTSFNDVFGFKVIGSNGNCIFLPAAGYRLCSDDLSGVGKYGLFWSSTGSAQDTDQACYLYFGSGGVGMGFCNKCDALSVRLVQD